MTRIKTSLTHGCYSIYGDDIKVLADSQISTDGIVVTGLYEVDESMIIGACLVLITLGSRVIAGFIKYSGVFLRPTHSLAWRKNNLPNR